MMNNWHIRECGQEPLRPLKEPAERLAVVVIALMKRGNGNNLQIMDLVRCVKFYKDYSKVDERLVDAIYEFPAHDLKFWELMYADARTLLAEAMQFLRYCESKRDDCEANINFNAIVEALPTEEEYMTSIATDKKRPELYSLILDNLEGADKRAEWLTLIKVGKNAAGFRLDYMILLVEALKELALNTMLQFNPGNWSSSNEDDE